MPGYCVPANFLKGRTICIIALNSADGTAETVRPAIGWIKYAAIPAAVCAVRLAQEERPARLGRVAPAASGDRWARVVRPVQPALPAARPVQPGQLAPPVRVVQLEQRDRLARLARAAQPVLPARLKHSFIHNCDFIIKYL